MNRKSHVALYGNVQMIRVYCGSCRMYALVLGGIKQCCDRPVGGDAPQKTRRISEPEHRRKKPSPKAQKVILAVQGNACLYCERRFGSFVWYRGKSRHVKLNWDHMLPYAYAADNTQENFAAACQFCNAWKSSLIFQTVEEVQIYVAQKWEEATARDGDMPEP